MKGAVLFGGKRRSSGERIAQNIDG